MVMQHKQTYNLNKRNSLSFVSEAKNVFDFTLELEKIIGKNFHFKYLDEQIRIHFKNITVFSEAKKIFSQTEF